MGILYIGCIWEVFMLLCQSCGEKDASIHLTKIVNGNIEEKHLCDACAKDGDELDFSLPFSFQTLFTGLIGSIKEDTQKVKDVSCPECGLLYKRFVETGKFGCSYCFNAFEEDVYELLKGIHGHSHHVGKIPLRINSKIRNIKKIEFLKEELNKSIAQEEFERAAYLRDEIKIVKEKLDSSEE